MTESVVDQAAGAIRAYAFSKRLTAGDRLPSERELADALGTSRPAVREAIRRLVVERVVEVRGRSGIYVASVVLDDVFAVRLSLEPLAAELAASRRTGTELRELQSQLVLLERDLADAAAFNATDSRLHALIAQFSGNDVLAGFIRQLTDLTLISRGLTARGEATRHGALADMTRLIAAIRSQDGAGASHAMRAHLDRVRLAALNETQRSALSPIARREQRSATA